jgi:hypothetical protein
LIGGFRGFPEGSVFISDVREERGKVGVGGGIAKKKKKKEGERLKKLRE